MVVYIYSCKLVQTCHVLPRVLVCFAEAGFYLVLDLIDKCLCGCYKYYYAIIVSPEASASNNMLSGKKKGMISCSEHNVIISTYGGTVRQVFFSKTKIC